MDFLGLVNSPPEKGIKPIPEEPPVPLSHWIDLHAIEEFINRVPEVAPDPPSFFLELHPLSTSVPEISPSPEKLSLELQSSEADAE